MPAPEAMTQGDDVLVERRDALKAIGSLAATVGMSVTPVTVHEAKDLAGVILITDRMLSDDEIDTLRWAWEAAWTGTAMETVRAVVLPPNVRAEFVRA